MVRKEPVFKQGLRPLNWLQIVPLSVGQPNLENGGSTGGEVELTGTTQVKDSQGARLLLSTRSAIRVLGAHKTRFYDTEAPGFCRITRDREMDK